MLYAIAHNITSAERFFEAGFPYIQIRFKNQSLLPFANDLRSLQHDFPKTSLIINDDLDFAQRINAWGVHLGQEDLASYLETKGAEFLKNLPLNLGISTHSDEEIQHALSFQPSYLGFGPIFSTQTKQVLSPTQGVRRLAEVVQQTPTPIVAIGGIDWGNLDQVLQAKPHAVAMISALSDLSLSQLQIKRQHYESFAH